MSCELSTRYDKYVELLIEQCVSIGFPLEYNAHNHLVMSNGSLYYNGEVIGSTEACFDTIKTLAIWWHPKLKTIQVSTICDTAIIPGGVE